MDRLVSRGSRARGARVSRVLDHCPNAAEGIDGEPDSDHYEGARATWHGARCRVLKYAEDPGR